MQFLKVVQKNYYIIEGPRLTGGITPSLKRKMSIFNENGFFMAGTTTGHFWFQQNLCHYSDEVLIGTNVHSLYKSILGIGQAKMI